MKGMLCLAPGLHTAQIEPVPPIHTSPCLPQVEMSGFFFSLTLILRNVEKREAEREAACAFSPCTFAQLPIKGLLGEVCGVQAA